MKRTCPLCGGRTLDHPDGFDGLSFRMNGQEVRFSGQEAIVFETLAKAKGRWVSRDHLLAELYPREEPDGAAGVLKTVAAGIRRKVKPLGVTVKGDRNANYRLEGA